ncbi:MAG: hypothetical protein H0W42_11945 [Gemmatimonadaceae bacterium]|nr:hypothetical protein [Gemmatimonadaceae bacterium]
MTDHDLRNLAIRAAGLSGVSGPANPALCEPLAREVIRRIDEEHDPSKDERIKILEWELKRSKAYVREYQEIYRTLTDAAIAISKRGGCAIPTDIQCDQVIENLADLNVIPFFRVKKLAAARTAIRLALIPPADQPKES